MTHASDSPTAEVCAPGDCPGPVLEAAPAREMALGGLAIAEAPPFVARGGGAAVA